jgi:hypothetical protein
MVLFVKPATVGRGARSYGPAPAFTTKFPAKFRAILSKFCFSLLNPLTKKTEKL